MGMTAADLRAIADLKAHLRDSFSASDKNVLKQSNLPFAPQDWFLGPKASAFKPLELAINTALESHCQARADYFPEDPPLPRNSSAFNDGAADHLQGKIKHLCSVLTASIPLASYRNQSHMYWDISTPAMAGYFAGMLYNQNNVAVEASPVTSAIEMLVGQDLCNVLGFGQQLSEGIEPWGHITCDGSVANMESLWAAQQLRYLPLMVKHALLNDPSLASAQNLTVQTSDGCLKILCTLSDWALLNIPVDNAIALPQRMTDEFGLPKPCIDAALSACSLRQLGLLEFNEQLLNDTHHRQPWLLVPQTAHYSWQKGASLLGLGLNAIQPINVDADGRMCMVALRQKLNEAREQQHPIIAVVAVLGSTEESAVDPLDKIFALRTEMQALGLSIYVHADAAWGGYFTTMLRNPSVDPGQENAKDFVCFASPYTQRQLNTIQHCDSVTLDPHKSGFVPYAAGSLCYRNGRVRTLNALKAPVVFHDSEDANVGLYGIEGSKPGASACSVFLAHDVIGLHNQGYGLLLNQCVYNNKLFYLGLIALFSDEDELTLTTFQRLPSEKSPAATEADIEAEKQYAITTFNEINCDEMAQLLAKPNKTSEEKRRCELFTQIGGDLSIINYSFNFKINGVVNRNVELFNELNNRIFNRLSLRLTDINTESVPSTPMFITASEFSTETYSNELIAHYAQRCGVLVTHEQRLKFLISTTQNPWLSQTSEGNFIPTLMNVLKTTACEERENLIHHHSLSNQ
ncbi:pyridoxal phosphate-dependent decarboxylase family protein [Reinekea marina]|uniref:Pyridoxal phosphate-dependent decarboxylase family protein n=2 Tax=Reinekea marina TaxID=1310421 RepID=A0ABV7WUG9_9GAMM